MRVSVSVVARLLVVAVLVWLWLLTITYIANHHQDVALWLLPSAITSWPSSVAPVNLKPDVFSGDRHAQLGGDAKAEKARHRKGTAARVKGGPTTGGKGQGGNLRQQKGKHNFTSQNYYTNVSASRTKWGELVAMPSMVLSADDFDLASLEKHLQVCTQERVDAVTRPMLSDEEFKFCQWALDSGPTGGKVKVGTSYGDLNGKQKEQYERYTCNSVAGGRNPSCDDSFGDEQIRSWRANPVREPSGKQADLCGPESTYSSRVNCFDSRSNARICFFKNAMMDMSRMSDVHRSFSTDSRSWRNGFLKTHCEPHITGRTIKYYEIYQPFKSSSSANATVCDFVIPEPVLVVSHDQSKNLGHTMNDYMNAWAQLWLAGMGSRASHVTLLSLDAVREGHNYHDELFQFGLHYAKSFFKVVKAPSFGPDAKVCFKQLIFLPRPFLLFTWDGWFQDMPCPMVGPSTLYQRWNLHVRRSYGLLDLPEALETNQGLRVLLVVRVVDPSSQDEARDPHFNTRVFVNLGALEAALVDLLAALTAETGVKATLSVVNLGTMTFEDQVRLVGRSSLLIGMHGAGITHAMHLPVGTKHCCGVLEIFPFGEFSPIRGHGNMARRMGLHYDRIFLDRNETNSPRYTNVNKGGPAFGSYVPLKAFNESVAGLLRAVAGGSGARATCIMPTVLRNPHFELNQTLPAVGSSGP